MRRLVLGDDRDVRHLAADVVGQRLQRVPHELFEVALVHAADGSEERLPGEVDNQPV